MIRLSAIPSLATDLTPRLLQYSAGIPILANIHVIEANSREGREMLRDGDVDFAIVIADELTPVAQWLASENMLFCMAENHPDKSTGPIRLAEALAEQLMLPAKGNPVRDLVERLATGVGENVKILHEIDGPNPRKHATIAGLGRTFLPWIAVKDEIDAGMVRSRLVVDPPIARHIGLEWRNGLKDEVTRTMQDALASLLGAMLR